jgi:RHS repeat-associated protein
MQRTYLNGSAATTNYTYNDLYELSGTSGVQSHSYAYDKVGNRTTVDSVNYTDNTRNQYIAVGGTNYTNSTNGNITSDGTSTFGYDAENRLVSFDTTGSANDATYAYDALGRRVKKTVNSTSTFFVYDGDDIIADYSSAGTLLREYIHGDKVDEILAMQAGTNTYYYHYDGLGSVTEITDDTGSIIENYTYDPFGAPSVTTSTINNRYRFTGREYDEESGLYHYRARAYSPTIGRFMQRDPIGYIDSMNLFSYVNNNPINYIDPLGLLGEKEIRIELDKNFGEKLTEEEKRKIASFTGRHIGIRDVGGLTSKKPEELRVAQDKLEERVRKSLEKADQQTKDLFKKFDELNKQKQEENIPCDKQNK